MWQVSTATLPGGRVLCELTLHSTANLPWTMDRAHCQQPAYVFTVSSQVCMFTLGIQLTWFNVKRQRTSDRVYASSAGLCNVIDDVHVRVCAGVWDVIDDVDVKHKLLFQGSVAQVYDY